MIVDGSMVLEYEPDAPWIRKWNWRGNNPCTNELLVEMVTATLTSFTSTPCFIILRYPRKRSPQHRLKPPLTYSFTYHHHRRPGSPPQSGPLLTTPSRRSYSSLEVAWSHISELLWLWRTRWRNGKLNISRVW